MAKRFLLVALAAAIMVGCPSGNRNESEIRFSWWGGDSRHAATLDAVQLFMAQNPGVTVRTEYGGWAGWPERIHTQMAGNTAPELMQVNHNWMDTLSRDGTGFYDLSTVPSAWLDLSGYPATLINTATINGRLNFVPISTTGRAFAWNTSALAANGFTMPTSWEEIIAMGQTWGARGTGHFVIGADLDFTYTLLLMYLQQRTGRDPFTTSPSVQIAYTVPELTDGFNFLRTLWDNNVVIPPPQYAAAGIPRTGAVEQLPGWINQTIFTSIDWDSAWGRYGAILPQGTVLSPGPYPTLQGAARQNNAIMQITMGFAINRNVGNAVENTARLLNFLINDPEAVRILRLERGIPANSRALDTLRAAGALSGLTYELNTMATQNVGMFWPTWTRHALFIAMFEDVIEAYGFNTINANQAATRFLNEGNQILTQLQQ
ncbi:MAG: ABC transporter substrate-binding protein [Spirochaetaceae bacterium]|jgi:oligogalacturonide transport system substrate-binding protein|nr:ABC transporter substrate-binding protein [Spirochaetaceae bacterium]